MITVIGSFDGDTSIPVLAPRANPDLSALTAHVTRTITRWRQVSGRSVQHPTDTTTERHGRQE